MKKRYTVGIDTSNYTTSVAVYDIVQKKIVLNKKQLLQVEHGSRGLRQSDALFSHIKNLPEICANLNEYYNRDELCAIGYSAYPRDEVGSYMPCFLAGKNAAHAMSSGFTPVYAFSHQAGHVAAALFHSERGYISDDFYAFHVSGGTTEVLDVKHKDVGFDIALLGGTLDINAGQLIDRSGVMMGFDFPCGPTIEKAANVFIDRGEKCSITQKISYDALGINLSGAENKVSKALKEGISNEEIAFFVLDFIARNLDYLSKKVKENSGHRVILYAGGVMSNAYIKKYLSDRHEALFAPPEYSSDNACGTAILAAKRYLAENEI